MPMLARGLSDNVLSLVTPYGTTLTLTVFDSLPVEFFT